MKNTNPFELSPTSVIIPKTAVGIIGIGRYLPDKIIDNDSFSNIHLTEEEQSFIKQSSGVKYRYYAEKQTFTELAIQASLNSLKNSKINADEIDLVIVTHTSRNLGQFTPPNCIAIQSAIGAKNATAINIDAGFSGWIYALVTAASFVCSGFYKKVLVTSGETLLTNTENNIMKALLIGDGAGAFIIGPTEQGLGFIGFHLMSKFYEGIAAEVKIKGGYACPNEINYTIKPYFSINPVSFKTDLPYVENLIPFSINKLLNELSIDKNDIHKFVFAQKFLALNKQWAKNIGIEYSKVHDTIEKTACVETSSIPIITCDAYETGMLKKGDLIVFADLGAKWNVGSAVLKWSI
jgi:3-oxoacyl-[acyl-carrier-protein] synthase III